MLPSFFSSTLFKKIDAGDTGTVRIFKLKPEPYATESSFLSLQGSSKKGSNIIQSVKLVKVNGAVLSIVTSHDSKYIAVGSDKGYVSVIDTGGPTLLYERRIASELSTAVVSLQFGMCSLHGFEKSVLVAATKDSSAWALESETGNILNTSPVHPKKPSKALLTHMLDEQGTSGRGSNASKGGNSFNDGTVKDLLLLCSEKATYVYSLPHVVQVTCRGYSQMQCNPITEEIMDRSYTGYRLRKRATSKSWTVLIQVRGYRLQVVELKEARARDKEL